MPSMRAATSLMRFNKVGADETSLNTVITKTEDFLIYKVSMPLTYRSNISAGATFYTKR